MKILISFVLMMLLASCQYGTTEESVKEASAANKNFKVIGYDKVDTTTSLITVQDVRTGCQYGLLTSTTNSAGVGGITPLMKPDGQQVCQ